ncbi:NAD(P)H-hydrate dehydratase [Reichenbachiella versicolor]|uniref:NAD(P)H-hydrate dehydratase n=1 Tax=Reichenbachiella versicolor TaxID=1821036 RepID=UPI000D6E8E8F|nr:NAD(P)H-hydrate dehydratase [Reichenbachiella versicolor]
MKLNLCLKVLDAEAIRQTDQFTITNEPIASIDLMERASEAFFNRFIELYDLNYSVFVVAGTGNNGGDGLAIARLLIEAGYKVSVAVIGDAEKGTKDFSTNLELLNKYLEPHFITSRKNFPELGQYNVVIDAIFGSGLSRPVTGVYADLITCINQSELKVVSVDIASGLGSSDKVENGEIIRANQTISFQVPKLPFFLPENDSFCGRVSIVDIGLDQGFVNNLPSKMYQTTPEFIASILKSRSKYVHKGQMGRDLIIAGSKGKIGASILASHSCLKSGAGLLTVAVPKCGTNVLQTALPEAMVDENQGEEFFTVAPKISNYDAIGIGPGLGTEYQTKKVVEQIISSTKGGLLIDADALNILSSDKKLLQKLPVDTVLTPHPGEFKRLVGSWSDDYERLVLQIEFARKYNVNVVLKGANTSVVTKDGLVFFNSTGNPGMATAGSGDVLTGIITAMIGQGYSGEEAAILGVYIHGLAADIYVDEHSMESLIASDIIDNLGKAFRSLREN